MGEAKEVVWSEKNNIWNCGNCHVAGIWPASRGLLCPECGKAIIPWKAEVKSEN